MAATDVTANERYPELVKEVSARARRTLEDGLSQYMVLMLVVAPTLRAPGGPDLELFEEVVKGTAGD